MGIAKPLPNERLRQTWHVIASRTWANNKQDTAQYGVARWIAGEGNVYGFRAACPRERAKAVGIWFCMAELPLAQKQAAGAPGNAFGKDVVAKRIGGASRSA